MKAIIKSILVLSFLIFSTSSFAEMCRCWCTADSQGIFSYEEVPDHAKHLSAKEKKLACDKGFDGMRCESASGGGDGVYSSCTVVGGNGKNSTEEDQYQSFGK